MRHLILLLLAAVAVGPLPGGRWVASPSGENPFLEKYLASAERLRKEGKLDHARRDVERALERDDQHLGAWQLLAEICVEMDDEDAAAYSYHRWLSTAENAGPAAPNRAAQKQVLNKLLALDEKAEEFQKLSRGYAAALLALAQEHLKKGRFHSALELYEEVLRIDRLNAAAKEGVDVVRKTGGEDVAEEDIYAGGEDPLAGVDPEWLAEEDAKHSEWKNAWSGETPNYRYKTDAGYLVLKTSMIAMEQMNRAYRKFFRYKEDGDTTPVISVLVYKNRDGYLKANGLPENDWTGGFYNGSEVQTFVGGQTGRESIRDMYNTLFHEAAHQFVDLTGKGGVPGWLNEAYASFFEGTVILSNGSVKWNQVASHRLFPLAERLKNGWMKDHADGVRDERGEWATPRGAPTLRILVESQYQWGPPWYAPTWGVVYFLYNYRDPETGVPVYRDALHQYYLSGAAGRADPVAHFESIVLAAASKTPVKTVDELNGVWRDWLLDLYEVQSGRKPDGKGGAEYGDLALARGDQALALEFYEEALTYDPDDFEVLWKLAALLEELGNTDRAAALYLQFQREIELRGLSADPRLQQARDKVKELDPLFQRQRKLKEQMAQDGLALAQDYRRRGLPTMAMEIARRLSATFSMPEAVALYTELARETGKSLARWKVAYNEFDLQGWSATGDGYRAYGKMIDASIEDDPSLQGEGGFVTQELACDVNFDSNYSLEAQMSHESGAKLMGLCFGRKDSNNLHAVVLHPKGYLDVSTKRGGVWETRDHRSVKIDENWQKLRLDVVENEVDIYLNDQYVRTMTMPNRDSLRGGFGLITGVGNCHYQDIRVLARDPHDPASRVERELRLEKIKADAALRSSGSFSGFRPPELKVGRWLQGEPQTLEALLDRPVALVFWAPYQDQKIPTTEYYEELLATYGPYEFRFVVVVSSQHSAEEVSEYLRDHPLDGFPIGLDDNYQTYRAYGLGPQGWGLPRTLLIDVDGTVVWEGDPGFRVGVGWDPEAGETFLDGPLEELLAKRRLRELKQHRGALAAAEAHFREGRIREAVAALTPLTDLDADFDDEVRSAKRLRDRIAAIGGSLPAQAEEARKAGRWLLAAAYLETAASQFQGLSAGDLAASRWKELGKNKDYKAALKGWQQLDKAVKDAGRGKDAAAVQAGIAKAREGAPGLEVEEAAQALEQALAGEGPAALAELWAKLQPKVNWDAAG